MDPEEYASFLDASWQGMRQQLMDAYPLLGPAHRGSIRGSVGGSSGLHSSQDSSVGNAGLGSGSSASFGFYPPLPAHLRPRNASMKSVKSVATSEYGYLLDGVASEATQNFHGDGEKLLGSGLKDISKEEAQKIRHRLRLRLRALSGSTLVSGKSLLDAVSSLGLTAYTELDMNDMVNRLADFIGLWFEPDPARPRPARPSSSAESMSMFRNSNSEDPRNLGRPRWKWPGTDITNGPNMRRSVTASIPFSDTHPTCTFNVVPAQALIDVFFSDEEEMVKKIFGPRLTNQFRAIQEIMLAGDTNRLVAELTFVRINDLAAPPEPMHPLMYIEPIVALLIIGNGVMIGLQIDPMYKDWSGWIYVELCFQSVLLLEVFLRMFLLGWRSYWCGSDKIWNFFDLFLFGSGGADLLLQFVSGGADADVEGAPTSLLRVCRLIRLVRIVKIFRIRWMRDLRLMVRGLIAGVKTLALAFVLLFAVLYVISGFAAMTIGTHFRTEEIGLLPYFQTIPDAMFTAFRCFTGECATDRGEPIHSLLAREFGYIFMFLYVACYMLVAMGIFNVILAVYVDITMKAAKENDSQNAEQYSRESLRIARITRELLKKFASAYKVFNDMDDQIKESVSGGARLDLVGKTAMFTESETEMNQVAITKELFLLIIQDSGVQRLMDELDLPPDRANLFEIIDADGSGTLQITELLHGLLKIRGEINKSDAVASLLATRAVQQMLSDFIVQNKRNFQDLFFELQQELSAFRHAPASRLSTASLASSGSSWSQATGLSAKSIQQRLAARQAGSPQHVHTGPSQGPSGDLPLAPRKQGARKITVTFDTQKAGDSSSGQSGISGQETIDTPGERNIMALGLATPYKPAVSENEDGALPTWPSPREAPEAPRAAAETPIGV